MTLALTRNCLAHLAKVAAASNRFTGPHKAASCSSSGSKVTFFMEGFWRGGLDIGCPTVELLAACE
jgi:hypothetical protein